MITISRKAALGVTALALLGMAAARPAAAQSVTVGTRTMTFGVPFDFGQEGQQVYAASDFSALSTLGTPFSINALTFFDNSGTGTAVVDPAIYTVSLSSTSKAVNGLDLTFDNNIGGDNTVIFTGLPGPVVNNELTIKATTPFVFDPSTGKNLLVTISKNVTSGTSNTSGVFADVDTAAGGKFSSQFSLDSNTTASAAYSDAGLVTRFDTSPVPEASTTVSFGLLLALGLGGLVVAAKRKKAASSL